MYRGCVFILLGAACLNCILGCWFSVHPVQDKQQGVKEGTSTGSRGLGWGPEAGICTKRHLYVILACILTVRTLLNPTWGCLGCFNRS